MKKAFAAAVMISLLAGNIFAGDIGSMMKAKARSFGGQSDTPPPPPSSSTPSQPATPEAPSMPPPPELTPEQQALLQLVNDFGALKEPATADFKTQLAGDLSAVARGANKPSAATVHKLANDLATALAGKTPAVNQRGRLAKDIQTVLGGANLPGTQMDDVISDVPSLLKRIGADTAAATAVGDDLKTANAEIKKKVAK